jgi:hypothetical protein
MPSDDTSGKVKPGKGAGRVLGPADLDGAERLSRECAGATTQRLALASSLHVRRCRVKPNSWAKARGSSWSKLFKQRCWGWQRISLWSL